jgi:DNA-binding MarR family transcriptional regulator
MSTSTLDVARLRQALTRLSRRLRAGDGGFGLTPTQASLLATISRTGAIGLSDLARREGIHATQLSRSIAHLEGAGLVRRSVDPDDRRAARVEATTEGGRVLRRLRDARTDVLRAQVEQLGADELRRLQDALPVLEQLVDKLSEQ